MQAASAFTIVQAAFNWLVDNYPKLADWTASARRAASLMVSLDGLERAESGDGGEGRPHRDHSTTATDAAHPPARPSVTLDDGTAVLDDTEIAIKPGERVLVAGESGTGKSTLVRAISGLWPWGGGQIEIKQRRQADDAAAAALHPDRHPAPRRDLSRRRRQPRDQGHRRRPSSTSASAISSTGSRTRRRGTRRSPAARSSASPSRASSCTTPTSSCSTKRPRRSIRRARTS